MPTPLPNSSLTIEKALPNDARIDEFYFGPEDYAVEVEEEFKSRIWEEDRDLFLFALEGELVAGARLDFWNRDPPHKDPEDGERRRYYLVIALGINVPFQGQRDPVSGQKYSRIIFDYIESKARDREDCVGLTLWVRAANERARAIYVHWGFQYVAEPFLDDDKLTYEMKKWF